VYTENYTHPVTTTYQPNQSVVRRSYVQPDNVVVRSSAVNPTGTTYVQGGQTVVRTSTGVTLNPTGSIVRGNDYDPTVTRYANGQKSDYVSIARL
jgi:hypothetical protein